MLLFYKQTNSYLTHILLWSKNSTAIKYTLILNIYLDYKIVTTTFDEPLFVMTQHKESLQKYPNSYAVSAANYFEVYMLVNTNNTLNTNGFSTSFGQGSFQGISCLYDLKNRCYIIWSHIICSVMYLIHLQREKTVLKRRCRRSTAWIWTFTI